MIGDGKAHISRVTGHDNVTFRAGVLDSHILTRIGSDTRFFDAAVSDHDYTAGLERLHPRSLICLDGALSAANIGPIVRGKPANREAVDKYVRLLPQIENRDGTVRACQ